MKNQIMTQNLIEIKTIVDHIIVAGSVVDVEDIIMYSLNSLLSIYNPFKTSIRTKLTLVSLEDLYMLI